MTSYDPFKWVNVSQLVIEKYRCFICKKVAHEPVICTNCKSLFCKICDNKHRYQKKSGCISCFNLSKSVFKKKVWEEILTLQIECPLYCDEVISYVKREAHMKKYCEHRVIENPSPWGNKRIRYSTAPSDDSSDYQCAGCGKETSDVLGHLERDLPQHLHNALKELKLLHVKNNLHAEEIQHLKHVIPGNIKAPCGDLLEEFSKCKKSYIHDFNEIQKFQAEIRQDQENLYIEHENLRKSLLQITEMTEQRQKMICDTQQEQEKMLRDALQEHKKMKNELCEMQTKIKNDLCEMQRKIKNEIRQGQSKIREKVQNVSEGLRDKIQNVSEGQLQIQEKVQNVSNQLQDVSKVQISTHTELRNLKVGQKEMKAELCQGQNQILHYLKFKDTVNPQ